VNPIMKKILFVTHEASRTGSPLNLLRFLRWLRKNTAQEFEMVVAKDGPLVADFAKLGPVHTPFTLGRKPESELRGFLERFALIYANSCWSTALVESWPFGDTPIVTHVLEVMDDSIDALGLKNLAAMIRFSNRFVVSTKAGARDLERRFGVPAERMSIHYCMVDDESILGGVSAEQRSALRRKAGMPEDAFVVAACGSVEMRKGPDLFVQIATRFCREFGGERPIRFIWIGGTRDFDLNRYLRRDIQRLGLGEQVEFVGESTNPGDLLALSDVLCVTARVEALAMAMMETASLGVPVVYFNGAGGAEEFCSYGGGCGVPYLDIDAMAAKCREFMVNPGSAAVMGHRGVETVRKSFSVDAVAPGLWKEVDAWLQKPPPMSPFRASGCSLGDIFASWNLDDSPDAKAVRETVGRNTSLREAQALVDQGRLSEAVAVLIRAARPRSTRDLEGVQETLVDIGGALKRLDPKKGDFLLREAEKLGQMTGRSVEEIRAELPNHSRRPESAV
jgi:glycosyltransferase involved in cell wall biosynthesis